MKKYRVITDKLNWLGIHGNHIIEFHAGDVRTIVNPYDSRLRKNIDIIEANTGIPIIDICIKQNPNWFEEIKEKDIEVTGNVHDLKYSELDMLTFGINVEREHKTRKRPYPAETLLSEYKAAKFSPKEEPKEFTRDDMKNLLLFVGNDQWVNPHHTGIQTKNFHDVLAERVLEYFMAAIKNK